MTRGKYATRAEQTRHITAAHSEVEAGRSAISRLTTENRALKAKVDAERARHQEVERMLRAQVREGTSDQVNALTMELRSSRDEVGSTRARALRLLEQICKVLTDEKITCLRPVGTTAAEIRQAIRADDLRNGPGRNGHVRRDARNAARGLWEGKYEIVTGFDE